MVSQGEVPVAPFHIGTGALEHLRERFGLLLALALLCWAQLGEGPTGRKQRGAQALGQHTKRLTSAHRARLGHTLEIEGGNQMRVHGVGRGLCQVELTHLLSDVPRDKLDRRLHLGKHTLGFLDAIPARLAESFVLGNGAHRVNLRLDICGNELPIATHAALQIDKVVRMADSTDTLSDLLALCAEALGLLASHFSVPLELLQAGGSLSGATRLPFCRRVARALRLALYLLEPLLSLGGRLRSRPLLHGQRA